MAKRSDTLETVLFAVELLRRIPRGRKVTCQRRFSSDPLSCLIAEVNLTHPGSFDCAARARRA